MRFLFFMLINCLVSINTFSQTDTLKTLNIEQVLQIVRQYHPASKVASINIEKAKVNQTIACSGFEPIVNYYLSNKTFDGTNYYHYSSPQITIPTWFGMEVYAGLENLSGSRLNENQTIGKTNYAGISVPLLKDLWFDKRRANLQIAKTLIKMSEAEQRNTLNDILFQAAESYWNWVRAYQTHKIVSQNVKNNEERLLLIVKSYKNGERPAIDTTEAKTQLLNFQLLEKEKWYEFQEATLLLSTFLWTPNNEAYLLPFSVQPQVGWENEVNIKALNLQLDNLLTTAQTNHPYLQILNYKTFQLRIERKLKFQEFLPKLDAQFSAIGKGYGLFANIPEAMKLQDNYQMGLKLEMPLLFLSGRGQYKMSNLKLKENDMLINQKRNQIQIKVQDYYNEFQTLKSQIALQSENYTNYNALLKAEKTRLENGESSLFLINMRENKTLEAMEKLIALKTKYFKSVYALQWATGIL